MQMNYTTETPTETGYYWLSSSQHSWRPVFLLVVHGSAYIYEILDKGSPTEINHCLDDGDKLRWIPLETPNVE